MSSAEREIEITATRASAEWDAPAGKRVRVAIVNEFFYPDNMGGTGQVLSQLARHLADHFPELEIEVITSRNLYRGSAGSLPWHDAWQGISIFRLPAPQVMRGSIRRRLLVNAFFSMAAVLRLLGRPRYDLLVVGTAPPTTPLTARLYQWLRRTPYVYIVYDLYPDIAVATKAVRARHPVIRVLRRLQRGWLHGAERTVVLGRCMGDYLAHQYQLSPDRIRVIPVGADPDAVSPRGKSTRFRARHGLEDFLVLYAGNFSRYQDFDTILDAARLLRDRGEKITFAFVGQGVQGDRIADRIRDEGLNNVRMFDFVPNEEYADLLASADAAFVTLEPGAEGLGVPSKFYNILAAGRPTVAVVAPGSEVARVVAEAECGVRVNQGRPEELAQVLAGLAADPARLDRMGANARRVFLEKYTVQKVAESFHGAFQEVLGGREAVSVLSQG